MEALGDAVVAGEAPHPDDLFDPFVEGFGEGESALQAALFEGFDQAELFGEADKNGCLNGFNGR